MSRHSFINGETMFSKLMSLKYERSQTNTQSCGLKKNSVSVGKPVYEEKLITMRDGARL